MKYAINDVVCSLFMPPLTNKKKCLGEYKGKANSYSHSFCWRESLLCH
jgi:hypothetical protein